MDIDHKTREIREGGGARDIADHPRLRPGDDILLRLPDREGDDAEIRCDLRAPRDRGGVVRERRVQQHEVRLQGGAQRHRIGQIGAQPDDRHRGLAFEDLGEPFAQEPHFGDDHDAQSPCIGGKQGRPVRYEICVHVQVPPLFLLSRQGSSSGWQDRQARQLDDTTSTHANRTTSREVAGFPSLGPASGCRPP
jgi:hypothetical protein